MELKEIKVDSILANFYQPRTKFDKEKIKELSESILSNGLINPITVTPDKKRQGKYMIVSGERRWQAHRVANLRTIQAVVKTYSTDGQFMVESLIENLHREDLTPTEKGKFCLKIMKEERIKNVSQLSKRINVKSDSLISRWIDDVEFRERNPSADRFTHWDVASTKGFEDKERIKLINYAEKKSISARKMAEDVVPTFRKSDEETKKALLSGKTTIEEAKQGNVPEPIQLERTANDVVNDVLSDLHSFKNNVDSLIKDTGRNQININDLRKSLASKAITTAGLHLRIFVEFVNILRRKGAKPDKHILKLIKANGKI